MEVRLLEELACRMDYVFCNLFGLHKQQFSSTRPTGVGSGQLKKHHPLSMKKTLLRFNPASPWRRFAITSASLCLGLAAASLQARPVPQNLAGGLGALVESNVNVKAGQAKANFNGFATQQAADYASLAIQDADTGRFLVDIHPTNNRVNAEKLVPILQKRFPSFTLTALDTKYRGVGVVEGFISLDDVSALGNMREVRSVSLGLKPELNR